MTVVPERFNNKGKNMIGDYVAYCIGGNKDGLNLTTSFSLIEKKDPKLKLLLLGIKIRKTKNIYFYGRANREIPVLLNNALILALARQLVLGGLNKINRKANSGNQEIPIYLKDGKTLFLLSQMTMKFANKMAYVIDNYENCLEIAKEAKN